MMHLCLARSTRLNSYPRVCCGYSYPLIEVGLSRSKLLLQNRHVTDAASIDVASHRGGNPSIGEASLSLGSGSQLEKLGRENDRESASNVALAGTSLAGSIASSVLPGGQRYYFIFCSLD